MIVSDSTTLIILFDLNRIDLLQNIFKKIYIPKSVYDEINFKNTIKLPDFIQTVKVENDELLEDLELLLDLGESEAICLSKQKNIPLIIDEKKGRKIALNLNINIIGLLGIVYINIKKNFITSDEAELFIEEAIANGYRISNKLIIQMFKKIKEK